MKKLYTLFAILFFIVAACSDEAVAPTSSPKNDKGKPPKNTTTEPAPTEPPVTGLTSFKVANLSIPTGGLPDAQRFYSDGSLRASTAYNPYGVTQVNRNGVPKVRFYVNPTLPAEYLSNTPTPYHYRAEFTRYPWRISHPLGTEEWLGFSYIFPSTEEGFAPNQTPVSIYQNHAGSIAGQTENPPALQLEIAAPNQIKSTDPYRATPLGGEILIVNNVRGFRYVAQGVRVVAGARLDIIIQIVYGLGNEGLFNVWINGNLCVFPGTGTIPAGNAGSTVWPPRTETEIAVGGNSKLGLYHHQLRLENAVTLNTSAGHSHMEVFMTDWNDVIRKPTDSDYKNTNAYKAVNTAAYP